jgi:hypothetical protein
MPRLIAFILVAVAIAWAAAFVDFGDAASTAAPSETPSPEPRTADERTASVPGPPRPNDKPPRDESVTRPDIRAQRNQARDDDRDEAPAEVDDHEADGEGAAVARAVAAAQRREGNVATEPPPNMDEHRERGQGAMSTAHNARMRKYASEPRDAQWALPREKALTELVRGTPFESMRVHCRTTTCQLILQTTEAESFEAFLALDGVRELTGADTDTPYSLRASRLSFFFEPSAD